MAISINTVAPVLAAQEVGGIAPELVLQPGSVVNAQVLKILSADLVRIAIASLSIDVASEIPLQQGQTLQLAVTQTKDGIRLAVVGQGGDAAGAAADAVTLSPDALADAAASRPTIVAPKNALSPLERAAVSVAAQAAATEQESLAPLFANLGAAVSASNLPPKLQEAIAQVLAQQTSLDQNLDGSDIKTAFQKSGIFLEASLASGSVPPQRRSRSQGRADRAAPDAASRRWAPMQRPEPRRRPRPSTQPEPALRRRPRVRRPGNPAAAGAVACRRRYRGAGQRRPQRACGSAECRTVGRRDLEPAAGSAAGARQSGAAAVAPKDVRGGDVTVHTNTPPPPFRGALPAAQPIAAPTIAPDAPLATTAHHLLDDTDAAIARQTLLQVASLPDRIDASAPKIDVSAPRWNFEIPFVTPQGTAMAQFEISRDGGGRGGRGGQAGVAGAILARRRAGRAGPRAGVADRRKDLGADVGGAARDRRATARRRVAIEPGAQPRRTSTPAIS